MSIEYTLYQKVQLFSPSRFRDKMKTSKGKKRYCNSYQEEQQHEPSFHEKLIFQRHHSQLKNTLLRGIVNTNRIWIISAIFETWRNNNCLNVKLVFCSDQHKSRGTIEANCTFIIQYILCGNENSEICGLDHSVNRPTRFLFCFGRI